MPNLHQKGIALILILFVLSLVAVTYFIENLNAKSMVLEREQRTGLVMSEAKQALIGYFAQSNVDSLALPNPDLRLTVAIPEGSQSGNAGAVNISLIGKLPWYSLGLELPKDGWSQCLWYVVSGRFKHSPGTAVLNWDTLGQIDVHDAAGNVLATNLAALVVSPGAILDSQDRSPSEAGLECGGNYDAANYLDTPNLANAISGELNYFAGSINNREASSVANKIFIQANTDFYNDRFLFISVDDIFTPLIKRVDFSLQVSSLLDDPYFTTVSISSGSKGTANVNCAALNALNRKFCVNWKEMLLLTALPVPSPIQIDGLTTISCSRVLLFGGAKQSPGQLRVSTADKANVANYLEGTNLAAFAIPVASSNNFSGTSVFNASNPSQDVIRCL